MRALSAGLFVAAAVALLPGIPRAACQAREPQNLAGVSVGVVSPPFGFEDPYSWMLGASLFYERRLQILGSTWVLAARCAGYGQYARVEPFEESYTIWGGGTLGWEAGRRLDPDFAFSVVPFAGLGLYGRRLAHDGAIYTARRPIILAGITFDLRLGRRLSAGTAVEPVLIMDRAPLVAVGQGARIGLRF